MASCGGEYRSKVPWMQFASHQAPVRYLLRNNLGSGHRGAVRIRHCHTEAMLRPAIHGPARFFLPSLLFPLPRVIFAKVRQSTPVVLTNLLLEIAVFKVRVTFDKCEGGLFENL